MRVRRQFVEVCIPSVKSELFELRKVNNAVPVLVGDREKTLHVIRLRREFQCLQPRLDLPPGRERGGSDVLESFVCDSARSWESDITA